MLPYVTIIFCCILGSLSADPWGKDADLVNRQRDEQPSESRQSSSSPLSILGEALISVHKNYISKADGPRSHYYPNSSQYTVDAMRKYGFFQGVAMGCDRLMRENDAAWVYRTYTKPTGEVMKWNPVP